MTDLRATLTIAGHPIHPMVVPIPIALFLAALVTDIVYVCDGSHGWAVASRWLLGGGLVGALLAALGGFIDFAGNSNIRALRDAWLHLFANLSLVLAFSGWKGGELVFRHGVGQIRPDVPQR